MKISDSSRSQFRMQVNGAVLIAVILLFSACAQGLRVKNLVNYPVLLDSLIALQNNSLLPDNVKYRGQEETLFHNFNQSIRIQGRQDDRPIWHSDSSGCFQVSGGARVHIQDFNFLGEQSDSVLIRINDGRLILENCDIAQAENWAIQIGPAGSLELRNVRFSNLGKGAIELDGGIVHIFNSEFDFAGETAIHAISGKQLEVHHASITNTMGSGILLNSVEEVWLDSVKVIDSFQNGIYLDQCDFALINGVESNRNGQHGLHIQNSSITGLLNFSAIGNLVHGILAQDVDTLRVVESKFIGNGESAGRIESVASTKMAGIEVGHSGSDGLKLFRGDEVSIHNSAFHAIPALALEIDSILVVKLLFNSVLNNKDGIHIGHFDSLEIHHNYLASNTGEASKIISGEQFQFTSNLVRQNHIGISANDVNSIQLDSNQVQDNTIGGSFGSIDRLIMSHNTWKTNKTGSSFSDLGHINSNGDRWEDNSDHAFEAMSAYEFVLSKARITGNRNGGLIHQASLKLESCVFDSGAGYALKLMNGSLTANGSKFFNHVAGIELSEGSQAKIVQSEFTDLDLAINASASVSLSLSFSELNQLENGIQIGNYGKAEILANYFHDIAGFSLKAVGPHLQSLYLRQNIFAETGGILSSKSRTGDINIFSNSFADNRVGFQINPKTVQRLDHNIFFNTDLAGFDMLKDKKSLRWNCFEPEMHEQYPEIDGELNLFADPLFGERYFLKADSPCLGSGENGLLIGALGTIDEERPGLTP